MAERALTAMVIIGGRPYLWIDANYARFAPDRARIVSGVVNVAVGVQQ